MGWKEIRRDRLQFSRLNYRLRILLLGLSALLIILSIVLAIIMFVFVLDIAIHPLNAKALVEQWSAIFLESPSPSASTTASPFNGPARWFAIFVLIVLAYLLIRIPLLMLQMGTQLLVACQEDNRSLRAFVQQILHDLSTGQFTQAALPPDDTTPPPDDR